MLHAAGQGFDHGLFKLQASDKDYQWKIENLCLAWNHTYGTYDAPTANNLRNLLKNSQTVV